MGLELECCVWSSIGEDLNEEKGDLQLKLFFKEIFLKTLLSNWFFHLNFLFVLICSCCCIHFICSTISQSVCLPVCLSVCLSRTIARAASPCGGYINVAGVSLSYTCLIWRTTIAIITTTKTWFSSSSLSSMILCSA